MSNIEAKRQESTRNFDAAWSTPGVRVDEVGPQGGGKRQILISRPDGMLENSNFKLREDPIPEPKEGEAVVQTMYISLDPTHRFWASDMVQYSPAVGLNTCMRAFGVGKVVKSSDEGKLATGSFVTGVLGVQEYCVGPIAGFNAAVPDVPLNWNCSIFSPVIGLTAWVGTNICNAKEGTTMVVSGCAGAVGSIAAQLGKLRGARVIGIAGGEAKCKFMMEELKLDGCIDYKAFTPGTDKFRDQLNTLCPDGIDSFFDNVGGPILDDVVLSMNVFGKIASCGHISAYNEKGQTGVSMNNWQNVLHKRITIQGFICFDHLANFGDALAELVPLAKSGQVKVEEDIQESGLENYLAILNKLFSGDTRGKLMMKVANI